jgi:hypothetical protein
MIRDSALEVRVYVVIPEFMIESEMMFAVTTQGEP